MENEARGGVSTVENPSLKAREGDRPDGCGGHGDVGHDVRALRAMSAGELEALGQQSLRDHLVAQAIASYGKYGPLRMETMESVLQDPDLLRHPVRLVYEFGEMAMHQFAQPDIDWRHTETDGRVIYLRPMLRQRPDLVPLAVAYMIPLINYGDIVRDEHCLSYGATLLGLTEEEYYGQLCGLCDIVGAESKG